jgi:hypothetical protein
MDSKVGKLRKVPECGIVDFNDKTKSIRKDTLVTTQARREHLDIIVIFEIFSASLSGW